VAYWVADRISVKDGYPVKTVRLWPDSGKPHPGEPNSTHRTYIADRCTKLQGEMIAWKQQNAQPQAPVSDGVQCDGSVSGLLRCYQLDHDSGYHGVRHETRKQYDYQLGALEKSVGHRVLSELTGRDFLQWFRDWQQGARQIGRASNMITMFRTVISYGVAILVDQECLRISVILANRTFERPAERTVVVNAEQVIAIRQAAHKLGYPEVALTSAIMFDLMLRQKDAIGEWVPLDHEGLSTVVRRGMKWINGIAWHEIDQNLMLTHRISKSVKGRSRVADQKAGITKVWNLHSYPMIMEELSLIPEAQRTGPVVRSHLDGDPVINRHFRTLWRECADAAGIPKEFECRDMRAGGITEALQAGGDVDSTRHAAGHKHGTMTERYSREGDARTESIAQLRAKKRAQG
jgi:integrase